MPLKRLRRVNEKKLVNLLLVRTAKDSATPFVFPKHGGFGNFSAWFGFLRSGGLPLRAQSEILCLAAFAKATAGKPVHSSVG